MLIYQHQTVLINTSSAIVFLCWLAQRLAQELPQVESFSPACGSVTGGEEMLITGQNINPESIVVFLEKGSGKWNHLLQLLFSNLVSLL